MTNISDLPDDVLLTVFLNNFQHSAMFSPALAMGPFSPWSRALSHKKSIVLVCKRWNALGTPFLYRDIVLRRYGEFTLLLQTLISTFLGSSTRSFVLADSFHVPGHEVQLFQRNLAVLLNLLPRLSNLSIQPIIPDKIRLDEPVNLSSITTIQLGENFPISYFCPLIRRYSTQLRCISCTIAAYSSIPRFLLPKLEELHVTLERSRRGEAIVSAGDTLHPILPMIWSMSALRSLFIKVGYPDTQNRWLPHLERFCHNYGSNLQFLDIRRQWRDRLKAAPYPVTRVLRKCPNLRDLSVDFCFDESTGMDENLPSLKMLEVFVHPSVHSGRTGDLEVDTSKHRASFPGLETIRYICLQSENLIISPVLDNVDTIDVLRDAFSWFASEHCTLRQIQEPYIRGTDSPHGQDIWVYCFEERVMDNASAYGTLEDEYSDADDDLFIPLTDDEETDSSSSSDEEFWNNADGVW